MILQIYLHLFIVVTHQIIVDNVKKRCLNTVKIDVINNMHLFIVVHQIIVDYAPFYRSYILVLFIFLKKPLFKIKIIYFINHNNVIY